MADCAKLGVSADGKRFYSAASGKLKRDQQCCANCPGVDCNDCPTPPATLNVVLDGTDCVDCEDATLDGSYCVAQVEGDPCKWLYEIGRLYILVEITGTDTEREISVTVQFNGITCASATEVETSCDFPKVLTDEVTGTGTITLSQCCEPPAETPCGNCCDCTPSSLTVVISGSSTAADGTWNLGHVPDTCTWDNCDASTIYVKATKSGENMRVEVTDTTGPTTLFDGNTTREHYGTCHKLRYIDDSGGGSPPVYDDYRIVNTAGSGHATVTGNCTPTCKTGCDEPFDGPYLTPVCNNPIICCPNCTPDKVSVVVSGLNHCTDCCNEFGIYRKVHSISLPGSFILDRIGGFGAPCEYRKNDVGTVTWEYFTDSGCTNGFGQSTTNLHALVSGSTFRIFEQGNFFSVFAVTGFVSGTICVGGVVANAQSCCGTPGLTAGGGFGGTATFTPC